MRVPPIPPAPFPEPHPPRTVPLPTPEAPERSAPSPSDMVVLSEAAYRALARARATGGLLLSREFPLPRLASRVSVAVRPAAEPGALHVEAVIADEREPVRALRLTATVRESWLEHAVQGAENEEERAQRALVALAALAALPGQRTVDVQAVDLPRIEPPLRGPVPTVTGSWLPAEYPPEALLPEPFGSAS